MQLESTQIGVSSTAALPGSRDPLPIGVGKQDRTKQRGALGAVVSWLLGPGTQVASDRGISKISGKITRVSGNSFIVTSGARSTTVDLGDATTILEVSAIEPSQIRAGDVVVVKGQTDDAVMLAASSVRVGSAYTQEHYQDLGSVERDPAPTGQPLTDAATVSSSKAPANSAATTDQRTLPTGATAMTTAMIEGTVQAVGSDYTQFTANTDVGLMTVVLSDETEVRAVATGGVADVTTDEWVTVQGTAKSDNTVVATTVLLASTAGLEGQMSRNGPGPRAGQA